MINIHTLSCCLLILNLHFKYLSSSRYYRRKITGEHISVLIFCTLESKICKEKLIIILIALVFLRPHIRAEEMTGYDSSVIFNVETQASFAGGENTPFWLVSNKHGLGSPQFNNGFVRGEIFKSMNPSSKFDWGAGADLTGAWNLPAPFAIRQLYGELHYRKIWINIGARNLYNGINNHRLSSGDLLFSGNAMAIPQARIGTYDFAPFWGTNEWFSVKAYLSYGFFTDSNWQKSWVSPEYTRNSGVLFCGRGLWLRGGNMEKFPLTFEVGIEMGTQFGGTIYNKGEKLKMPSRFADWIKAIIPSAGGDNTPMGEQTNVQGNMTGEYSMSTSFSPKKGWNIRAYWEHYFEDHSQMTFEYGLWKDGLWGLELTFPDNPFIKKFVYEYVATKDQTGAVNNDSTPEIPEQVSGRDNYFNHYIYGSWQNWGMTIGTPLAISPLYNRNHQLTILNTRFIANHFALEGQPTSALNWRFLLTFSRNWGSYWYPLTDVMDSCSGLCEVTYKPKTFHGFYAKGALAWDHGHLLGNNFGGMISLGFEGSFNFSSK